MEKETRFKKKRNRAIAGLVVIGGIVLLLAVYSQDIKKFLPTAIKFIFPSAKKIPFVGKMLEKAAPKGKEEAQQEPQKIVPVTVNKVAKRDFEDILPVMGTVKGQKEVDLRFEINGVIDSINFREGDMISKGDVIITLNQKDALLKLEYSQSKLKTAESQSRLAKKKLEINQNLYEIGAIIKSKLEEAELEYETARNQEASAKKEVEFAQTEIEKTYLLSPLDGVMGAKDAESGEFVTSQNKVATVIDIESVFVEVGVIEKELPKVALGQKATITVDAYPNVEFQGTIDNILPVIEGKSRTLTCKIKCVNPKAQLLPGMFARANVFIFGQKNALIVPNTCLLDQNEDGVFDSTYVVTSDNIAQLRKLNVGYLTTDYAVINSGLKENEMVVTEARAELSDGAKVEILETQEAIGAGEEAEESEEKGKGKLPL